MEDFAIRPYKRYTDVATSNLNQLPLILSNDPQTLLKGTKGAIAFDLVTDKTWECVELPGQRWRPISSGGGGGSNVTDYGLATQGTQSIPDSTPTIITNFAGFDNTGGWVPISGQYTAPAGGPFTLSVIANVVYSGGFNNMGTRGLQLILKPTVGPEVIVIRRNIEPSSAVSLTTEVTLSHALSVPTGYKVYVKAFQTSGSPINISVGSTLTGYAIAP